MKSDLVKTNSYKESNFIKKVHVPHKTVDEIYNKKSAIIATVTQ